MALHRAARRSAVEAGGVLTMYLASGKKKHDRYFWLEGDAPARLCWDKKRREGARKSFPLRSVSDEPTIRSGTAWFKAIDADGSGSLDAAEVASLYRQAHGESLSGAELAAAIRQMDTDGNGEISEEEFLVWWRTNGGDLETYRHLAFSATCVGGVHLILVAPTVEEKKAWVTGLRAALGSKTSSAEDLLPETPARAPSPSFVYGASPAAAEQASQFVRCQLLLPFPFAADCACCMQLSLVADFVELQREVKLALARYSKAADDPQRDYPGYQQLRAFCEEKRRAAFAAMGTARQMRVEPAAAFDAETLVGLRVQFKEGKELAKVNAEAMLELEAWRSAEMDAALDGFEEAHALAHREVVSQFRVRA